MVIGNDSIIDMILYELIELKNIPVEDSLEGVTVDIPDYWEELFETDIPVITDDTQVVSDRVRVNIYDFVESMHIWLCSGGGVNIYDIVDGSYHMNSFPSKGRVFCDNTEHSSMNLTKNRKNYERHLYSNI